MELAMKSKKKILLLLFLLSNQSLFSKILTLEEIKLESESQEKKEKLEKIKKEEPSRKKEEDLIYYRGDELKVLQKKNILHLTGNVFVEKGLMSLSSEKAVIFFSKSREAEKVEATGKVHIIKRKDKETDRVDAFSDKAIYFPQEKKITLIGNAIVKRPYDTIEGDILHYNIETEEMSGKHIKGFLSSLEKKQEKKQD